MISGILKNGFGIKRREVHPAKEGFELLLKNINHYFESYPEQKDEFKEEIYYLNNELNTISEEVKLLYSIYPYSFVKEYQYENIDVFKDSETNMYYVFHEGKQLFFHRGFKDVESVQKCYCYLLIEQHKNSPHCYFTEFWNFSNMHTVADLGAAEGIFSLSIIDEVKFIYLFESDPLWLEALYKTFEPWKHKVIIVNKFIGEETNDDTVAIKDYFANLPLDFIKMDIEGAELKTILGSKQFFKTRDLNIVIATYHHHDHAYQINKLLNEYGFITKFNDNSMLFIYDKLKPPYFRKGILKGFKKEPSANNYK